jgi:hypothetical protein
MSASYRNYDTHQLMVVMSFLPGIAISCSVWAHWQVQILQYLLVGQGHCNTHQWVVVASCQPGAVTILGAT